MKQRRLFLIAHGLRTMNGHHYMEARAFREEAERQGVEAVILCHQTVDEAIRQELDAHPAFDCVPYWPPVPDGKIQQWRHMSSYALSFKKGLQEWSGEPIGANDVLVGTLIRARDMLGVVKWLKTLPPHHRPWLSLNFMIDDITLPHRDGDQWRVDESSARAYRSAFRKLRKVVSAKKLSLVAGGANYPAVMSDVLGVKVQAAPLPVQLDIKAPAATGTHPNSEPVLAYLGHMQPAKGSDMIGSAIQRVLEKHPNCRFFLQANPEKYLELWEKQIGAQGLHRVTIHKGSMSQEAYQHVFCSADIILLPYQATDYRLRTSGVFAEAMALGKVAVVPASTWMEEMAVSQGGGAVVYQEQTEECLAEGILKALDELPALCEGMAALRDHWREKMGMKAYVRQVLAAAE